MVRRQRPKNYWPWLTKIGVQRQMAAKGQAIHHDALRHRADTSASAPVEGGAKEVTQLELGKIIQEAKREST